ncbi:MULTISPECIES: hypothetical protein [Halobacteriovorax]|uniref:Uncharacterized protein n=1 Tax=Halobacteriovorax vibrionivorans TaxID=2152716 RepID=A0ABY0IKB8_9BACT|nr:MULTISPECIES: hypothetical protein [Halobacteriovorax]AYF45984.1 hypothetical protein BALOs_3002 [Halobacteriovorax sp. BALOs_7]RZF23010.1 hypothetical protein DAY19_04360 [Halobacteriovorax vibrionivorans]TGD45697.1 hypothetical protein EP118_14905 [Halobacteriovorax sp. Y22]
MKDQVHNQGELKELKVNIEADVVESFQHMAENTGIALDELIVVALKRFRASHSDYEKKVFQVD